MRKKEMARLPRGEGEELDSPGDKELCTRRGYCGPFVKEAFYNAYPDPMWHGYGDCVVCSSTRLVAAEETRRRQALSGPGLPVPEQ